LVQLGRHTPLGLATVSQTSPAVVQSEFWVQPQTLFEARHTGASPPQPLLSAHWQLPFTEQVWLGRQSESISQPPQVPSVHPGASYGQSPADWHPISPEEPLSPLDELLVLVAGLPLLVPAVPEEDETVEPDVVELLTPPLEDTAPDVELALGQTGAAPVGVHAPA
jgi:hypothetical protein